MAIKEIRAYNSGLGTYLRDFICDTEVDLTDLPGLEDGVPIGSTALCLENGIMYILSPTDTWKIKEYPKADLVNGLIPAEYLPSYVDEALEFDSFDDFPEIGEEGKIYVALDTSKTYRWSGSMYIALIPDEIDGGE